MKMGKIGASGSYRMARFRVFQKRIRTKANLLLG